MTIFLLVFQKLNEKINVIRVDNPAKALKVCLKILSMYVLRIDIGVVMDFVLNEVIRLILFFDIKSSLA